MVNKTGKTFHAKTGKGKNVRYAFGSINRMSVLSSTQKGTIKRYNSAGTEYAEVDIVALRRAAKANTVKARFTPDGIGFFCIQDLPTSMYTVHKVPKTTKSRAAKPKP